MTVALAGNTAAFAGLVERNRARVEAVIERTGEPTCSSGSRLRASPLATVPGPLAEAVELRPLVVTARGRESCSAYTRHRGVGHVSPESQAMSATTSVISSPIIWSRRAGGTREHRAGAPRFGRLKGPSATTSVGLPRCIR